jgi:protein-S-isoprenylcysteine O-methyltransferase Ste14
MMLKSIGDMLFVKRIAISRCGLAALFLLMLVTESAQAGDFAGAGLFAAGVVLVSTAAIGRLWCTLYIGGHKNDRLITLGPYSITRNPLYFFTFLGFIGVGCLHEAYTFILLFILLFALIYPPVIKREEEYLRRTFGSAYQEYCGSTPQFFPNLKALREPDEYVFHTFQFRRAMKDVVWFIWIIGILEVIEKIQQMQLVIPLYRLP